MGREREPKRLTHRAAARSRHEAASRWLSEEIDEALDSEEPIEVSAVPDAVQARPKPLVRRP